MTDLVPVKRALISVSDKSGLDSLASALAWLQAKAARRLSCSQSNCSSHCSRAPLMSFGSAVSASSRKYSACRLRMVSSSPDSHNFSLAYCRTNSCIS